MLSEDEDTGGWGTSKRDYYNADVIETEADALEEEAEARRLQQKRLQGMTEADFGFDETEWLNAGEAGGEDGQDDDHGGVITEVLPQLQITEDMGPEERFKIMKSRYPEFEPLSREFLDLRPMHKDLAVAAAGAEAVIQHDLSLNSVTSGKGHARVKAGLTSVAVVKFRALTAYLGALSMYFALLTSTPKNNHGSSVALPSSELRDHGVMDSLVRCRELWEKVKDLRIPDAMEMVINDVEGHNGTAEKVELLNKNNNGINELASAIPVKKTKRSKGQRVAEAAQADAEARRAERVRKTEAELTILSRLTATSKRRPKSEFLDQTPQQNEEDSDFGEETTLTPHEAAEKAKRKKSLRFYTSQIAQKANKRDAAGRDAGGDADLPYRERLKDRQARLNAEAEKRGKKRSMANSEPLGGDTDEEDNRAATELREGGENDDDYYDLVAAKSKRKKAEKKEIAKVHEQAAKEGGRVEIREEVGPDGKRAITYAIEKNKGLAPKRKKDVRNPRVKKRKKYEEKKKKLGSVRQVYKGGEERGGYGGELTGIKKGLVKSVKL